MEISLAPQVKKIIGDSVSSGVYAKAEDVVTAALLQWHAEAAENHSR